MVSADGVYDDLRGWDTLPYLGSEFYLEYGNFDYLRDRAVEHDRCRLGRAGESEGCADEDGD